ncbi:MAG: hypothetical protein WD824_08610 [Cyclobacteriaceae bacterium]
MPFKKTEINLADLPEIETPVMLNIASPAMAFQFSHLPNKGVGLAREEFIINNYIQVHPLALLHHRKLSDKHLTDQISTIIKGYDSGEDFFVCRMDCKNCSGLLSE